MPDSFYSNQSKENLSQLKENVSFILWNFALFYELVAREMFLLVSQSFVAAYIKVN